jgi:hypothetical protein
MQSACYISPTAGSRNPSLTDSVVYRCAGLNLTPRTEAFSSAQHEAILPHLTGGISIEQVVGADAVQREAVAGVPISVGEYGLISEAGVATGTAKKIRVNARAHDSQLGETAGSERSSLDGCLIDDITGGGIRLVHERRTEHIHFGGHSSDLEIDVHRGGAIAVNVYFRVAFGVEAFFGECQLIRTGG